MEKTVCETGPWERTSQVFTNVYVKVKWCREFYQVHYISVCDTGSLHLWNENVRRKHAFPLVTRHKNSYATHNIQSENTKVMVATSPPPLHFHSE